MGVGAIHKPRKLPNPSEFLQFAALALAPALVSSGLAAGGLHVSRLAPHHLACDPPAVIPHQHAVLMAPRSCKITPSFSARMCFVSVPNYPSGHASRGVSQARRIGANERMAHSFNTPKHSTTRPSSKSGHFAAHAVSHVWSSGVARGAHTHPEWTWLVGAYQHRASERKLRACGISGCSSVSSVAIFRRNAKPEVPSAAI